MELTGAQALIKSLEMCDVEVMFGLPGGAILPVYDPILDSKIRHVLVRHEQGAGHKAQGYAHVTGKPGVAIVTSGPAATNIVTPLCDAYMDSIPMVAITGQVALGSIGSDAFQECDTTGITMAVTKHNYLVTDVKDLAKNLEVKNIIKLEAMASDQESLELYSNIVFYIPKDIYLDQLPLIDNRLIYDGITLSSYITNDKVFIKEHKLNELNLKKQRLLMEIKELKNG